MRLIPLACLGIFLAAAAEPPSVGAPQIVPNDTWAYIVTTEDRTGWHQTRIQSTVEHANASMIATSNRPDGAEVAPVEHMAGGDWSRVRSINGKETVVNRPLAFPLKIGKIWDVDYTEDHPNRARIRERFQSTYTVVGWEDITVSAGTFHALKIEADGQWTATLAPAVTAVAGSRLDAQGATTVTQTNRIRPTTATGRTYKAFWYVPAVKRWVKSVEEYYSSGGTRSERHTEELASYKVAE